MRFISAGESHGQKLTVILDGFPGGVTIDPSFIMKELRRRKIGYGRGGRMQIESDTPVITAGVRFGETIGAPVAIEIDNKDFANWLSIMGPFAKRTKEREIVKPRPGHADLPGILKYRRDDIRDILERASARETASRVAVGAVCKVFLKNLGINIYSTVFEIGGAGVPWKASLIELLTKKKHITEFHKISEKNDVRMPLRNVSDIHRHIDDAKRKGDSLGGVFVVVATGVPPGIGSHVQYDMRIDGGLTALLMSIPAVKAVSSGGGILAAERTGVTYHDSIRYDPKHGVYRKTNFAGGIEGGISNGEDIIFTCFMKPIPTLLTPLPSIDISLHKETTAVYERSDVTAVPACSVVAEAMLAFGIADEITKKFGCDSLPEILRNYHSYLSSIKKTWKRSTL